MAETQAPATEEPTVPVPEGDTVAAAVPPPSGQTDAAQGQTADSAATEELTPPDDVKESWNNLPPDVKKIVNRAYTQARQRDSQKLKEHPGQALLDAYERDPINTHNAIAAQLRAKGLLKDGDTPPAPPITPQAEEVFGKLAETFGPEAAQLLRQYADGLVQKEIGPLKQWAGQTVAETTHAQAQALKAAFEAKNPGALAKYEAKMAETALLLTEGGRIPAGIKADQWLDYLYRIVAHDDLVNAEAQKLLTRMQESATAERPASAVPQGRVAKKAPSLDEFGGNFEAAGRAAAEAAQRGDVWE